MTESVTIPARFNGPPGSGNGGYTCGLVAGLVGAEVASVALRAPSPLERPLDVAREGERVELRDGATAVAEGAPAELVLDVPDAVSPARAAEASAAGSAGWAANHPFPTCVVCGPARTPGDGMRLFPAPLDGDLHATAWRPDDSVGDGHGRVRPECVWAALDCPTSAPVANFGTGPPVVLANLTARLGRAVRVDEPHAIVSWPLRVDGRKRHAAAALFDSQGRVLGAARALWIELRQ